MIAAVSDTPDFSVRSEDLLALRRYIVPRAAGRWHPDQRPAGIPGKRRGPGVETVDVRVFAEGDDIRHIDRNVTARTGIPHVRAFREERGATVLLLADFRPAMRWGTRRTLRSVAAAEALALGAWRATEAGGRVGLYAFGMGPARYLPPRGRMTGMAAVAGWLAAAHAAHLDPDPRAAGSETLAEALEAADRLAPTGATLVLATALDDEGPAFEALAGTLGRAGRLRLLLVRDAFEAAPPPGAYPFAGPDERRHWGHIAAANRAADDRLDHLGRLGIPVLVVETAAGAEAIARAWDWFDGPGR